MQQVIHQLRLHIDEEQRAIEGVDAATRAFLQADFHVCLAENMGHRLLADTLRNLTARTTLPATLYQSDHSAEQSCADHASIVVALERGDAEQARTLMLAHIGSARDHAPGGSARRAPVRHLEPRAAVKPKRMRPRSNARPDQRHQPSKPVNPAGPPRFLGFHKPYGVASQFTP